MLQARGQLDEALRIRREEQLPVFERLGDGYARAVTRWKIGRQLLGAAGAAAQGAVVWLAAAHADMSGMGLPEAQQMADEMRQWGLDLAHERNPQPPATRRRFDLQPVKPAVLLRAAWLTFVRPTD